MSISLTNTPLYKQIEELLTKRIACGDWPPGMILPAEPKLAKELGVSAGTVRKALDRMTERKLVTRRQGFGTLVTSLDKRESLYRFFKLIDHKGQRIMPEVLEDQKNIRLATQTECSALDLPSGSEVLDVTRLRSMNEQIMMIDRVILPLPRFDALSSSLGPLPDTLYDHYETACGVTVVRIEERLSAVAAQDHEAALHGIHAGDPLLRIDRRAFSFDDIPVELRHSVVATHDYAYLSELQ